VHVCDKITRFKENELAQLRVIERDQYRQEVDKARREVCMFEDERSTVLSASIGV